jgi:hypothetical protein
MNENRIPLHVFEVLEEEYMSLYGPIPENDKLLIELPDEWGENSAGVGRSRVVEAALNWGFHRGHLKNPVGFAADLLPAADDEPRDGGRRGISGSHDEQVKVRLREYLREKITETVKVEGLKELAAWELAADGATRPPTTLVQPLRDALNELLTKQDLYDQERFSKDRLGRASYGLARLHESVAFDSSDPEADAGEQVKQPDYNSPLAHFNRLLLEDAFPDYIEKVQDIRLAAIHQRLHEMRPAALSLSGGGIRSGTFALGLIQGLARHNLLEKFDYLSTVSGGGYIGGWLTAWLHRHEDGMRGVTRDLKNSDPTSKIDPDPQPLQHLRQNSNFITPRAGFLSADTWSFAGIYLRNLLLNWMVFIPLLLGVAMLPRIVLTATTWQPVGPPESVEALGEAYALRPAEAEKLKDIPKERQVVYQPKRLVEDFFDVPGIGGLFGIEGDKHLYPRHLMLLAGFLCGVWALGYIGFNRPSERGVLMRSRFWRDRTTQKSFLSWCLLPLVLSAALLTTYWAWSQEAAMVSRGPQYFLVFGLAFTFFGWLIASFVLSRFSQSFPRLLLEGLVILVAGAFGGFLFWILSLFDLSGSPVVGYGLNIRDGELIRPPFAWTDWTSWSWTDWTTELYVCLGVPIFLLVFWAATSLFVGVSSRNKRIDDQDREWWARLGGWLLIAALAWAALSAVVIFGPLALLASPKLLGAIGGLSGLVTILVARSAGTPAREGADDKKGKAKAGAVAGLLGSSLTLLALVFLASFLALLSLTATGITWKLVQEINESIGAGTAPAWVEGLTNIPDDRPEEGRVVNRGFEDYVSYITPVVPTTVRPAPTPQRDAPAALPVRTTGPASEEDAGWRLEEADAYTGAKITHLNVLHHTHVVFNLLLCGFFLLIGWLLSTRINLNLFSLHGGYRDRLIRGFLGASRPPGQRRPNPFTGFDPADNIQMHELRWMLFDEGDLRAPAALARQLLGKPDASSDEANAGGTKPADDALSDYLKDKGLLAELGALSNLEPSPTLTAALRTDLNHALRTERLYVGKFAEQHLKSDRAEAIRRRYIETLKQSSGLSWAGVRPEDIPLHSEYSILLNRLVFEEAYPKMFRPGPPPPYRMLHVVNTTLNLVGGNNLAWQQRKAEPFSISPLHSGCFRVGYRHSREYGGEEGVSLGTAVAVSGAAASSNMGYYTSSPVISLLLTLFNVRLGWWLGNPGPAGNQTYRLRAPNNSVRPVVEEALGLTDDQHPYVYLTDGGHFENLALYEMVLRRCHIIVCSDAAEDGEYRFGDLGNAVRKIRIDLGVPIDFPCIEIYGSDTQKERGGKRGMYWAIGRIRYSCVDLLKPQGTGGEAPSAERAPDGLLLYIKPAVYGNEPRDVFEYKKSFPAFPHQSTADQFFDEPQFESYRALGSFIMDELCDKGFMDELCDKGFKDPELKLVIRRAFARLYEYCQQNGSHLDEDFVGWLSKLTGTSVTSGKVTPLETPCNTTGEGKSGDEQP